MVHAARDDDPEAFGELFQRWFDRSWNVARNIIRTDDLAAEIAQDAMLKAWQGLHRLDNPDAFGGWLLRITRNQALNRLQREQRSRATEDDVVSGLQDRQSSQGHDSLLGGQIGPDVNAVVDIRDRQELVWAAARVLGERDLSLLDLHLRHGLTPAEIADELDVEANAAHQQLFRLRGRLGEAIGSYLLWRNGRPLCDGLAAAVSGEKAFDRSVWRAVKKHQAQCEECSERRAGLVDPVKLFASVPLVAVPAQLKAQAAAALAEAGVPVGQPGGGMSGGGSSLESGSGGPDGGAGPSGSGLDRGGPGQSGGAGQGPSTSGAVATESMVPPPVAIPQPVLATHPTSFGPSPQPPLAESSALTARGVAWTVTRRAWGRSLLAVFGALLALLVFVALSGSLALSDVVPFLGGDDGLSIGSEALAGPLADDDPADATDTATEAAGGGNVLTPADSDETDDAGQDGGDEAPATTATTAPSTTGQESSSTSSASSSSTGSTADTTPTSTSTSEVTVTSSSTTTSQSTTTTTELTTTTTESTTTTTELTTTSTPPPDPPKIIRFISRRADGRQCAIRGHEPYEALWATENATSVELTLPDGSTRTGKPSGSAPFCAEPQSSISLRAIGPGGEDKATISI